MSAEEKHTVELRYNESPGEFRHGSVYWRVRYGERPVIPLVFPRGVYDHIKMHLFLNEDYKIVYNMSELNSIPIMRFCYRTI